MIAAHFSGVEDQLWIWMLAMIRPGAAMLVAPIFSAASIPLPLRLILALAIGIAGLNSGSLTLSAHDMLSLTGIIFVIGEVLVGLAIGFALQIGYSAAFVAGETISNSMGLGFASMSDPQTGQSTPVIGQFLSVLATLLLLAMDGHLVLISIIVSSYETLPPGAAILSPEALYGLVEFGGTLFAMGIVIAIPVGGALILIQLIMAMLARSAPSLNLFAVGMPVALLTGMTLLAITAPIMADAVMQSMEAGLDQSALLAGRT